MSNGEPKFCTNCIGVIKEIFPTSNVAQPKGDSPQQVTSVVRSNATTGWISVGDRLPDVGDSVLTCNINGICMDEQEPVIGFINESDNKWYMPWTECELTPTHWMYLPGIPEV